MIKYIGNIFKGIYALMQGMYVSWLNLWRPKVTEKYPENRGKKEPFERSRGQVVMPHDANNQHQCTACMICANNCPNGTLVVTSKMEVDPETGKERKVLDKYMYNVGECIFCGLCTRSCPQGAIEWSPEFEHSVFTRGKLDYQLNKEGSSLKKKTAAPKPAAPVAKPAAEPVKEAKVETQPVSEKPETATEKTAVEPEVKVKQLNPSEATQETPNLVEVTPSDVATAPITATKEEAAPSNE